MLTVNIIRAYLDMTLYTKDIQGNDVIMVMVGENNSVYKEVAFLLSELLGKDKIISYLKEVYEFMRNYHKNVDYYKFQIGKDDNVRLKNYILPMNSERDRVAKLIYDELIKVTITPPKPQLPGPVYIREDKIGEPNVKT